MGSSDPFRNVRFEEPVGVAGNRELEAGSRKPGILGRIFGRRREPVEAGLVVFRARRNEARKFLESLPDGRMKEVAFAIVRGRWGEKVPSLEEVKEALIEDKGDELRIRRDLILALAFGSRKQEFDERGVIRDSEAVNAFYFGIGDFNRINCVLRRKEEEAVRAKGEDREKALAEIGNMLGMIARKDRLDALGLVAEIVEEMGKNLCSKEVCWRMEGIRANIETTGDKLAALREIAEFVKENGARPSGRNIKSYIPRAEGRKIDIMLAAMPGKIAADAAAVMERGKPRSCKEFVRMLEEDEGDGEKRKQAVLGAIFPKGIISGLVPEILDEKVARNIAYFCIADIVKATSLADGFNGQIKRNALETILRIAKRLPEGARMEVPRIIAKAMENLVGQGRPKAWIVTDWLAELNNYMLIPDKNIAWNKIVWICTDPMKILIQEK